MEIRPITELGVEWLQRVLAEPGFADEVLSDEETLTAVARTVLGHGFRCRCPSCQAGVTKPRSSNPKETTG